MRRLTDRPGGRDALLDTLVIRCGKNLDIFGTLTQWLVSHFPSTKGFLTTLQTKPRETLLAIEKHVRDKPLLLVFDGADELMKPTDTFAWEFANNTFQNLLLALADVEWSIFDGCDESLSLGKVSRASR